MSRDHFTILTMLAALFLESPAVAQERQWIAQAYPEGAEMMYGLPESDDVMFAIRCDAASKEIFVGFAHQPVGVGPGGAIDLFVSSEVGEVILPATVSYFEEVDLYLIETGNVASHPLREVLTGGETLSVMVEDGSEEIPLAGASEGFEKVFEACGL